MQAHPLVATLNRFILGKPEQSGSIAELNLSGFDFPTELEKLFQCILHQQPLPPLVILTGNAGDGKSHLIFKIWLYLTQSLPFLSLQPGELPTLHQLNQAELVAALRSFQQQFSKGRADAVVEVGNFLLVKDASAVEPVELKEVLIQAFTRLFDKNNSHEAKVALVSINEGVLRSQLKEIREDSPVFSSLIDEIVSTLEESKGFYSPTEIALRNSRHPSSEEAHLSPLVLNLNTRDLDASLLNAILTELAQVHAFLGERSPCAPCRVSAHCPIRFNMLILGDATHPARGRIAILFEMLNSIGHHVTLREVLSVLAYALTGNLTCEAIQESFLTHEAVQLSFFPDDDLSLPQYQDRALLQLLPFLFFNGLFTQSIRQEEIDKLGQIIPLMSLAPKLSEERVLFHLGLLDPAGFSAPSHDVITSFASGTVSPLREASLAQQGTEEPVRSLDEAIFGVVRTTGQRMSTKGIPDARWLRSLVIATKRHAFFIDTDGSSALRHTVFVFYEEFKSLVTILQKKNRSYSDKTLISARLHNIVEALNQFQQPRTVGQSIRDYLEMVQRDHLVLFKRIPTTEFDLVPATLLPNEYVEQTQVRVRVLHKQSHISLDCDLLLFELLRRFVSGSLSLAGLEPRVTDIENFLTRLRGASGNQSDAYTIVDRAITFSVGDGQIIVRHT